jgi:hypothetical protein
MARRSSRSVPSDLIPLDDEVDKVFGEAVVLKPMRTNSSGYRAAIPDETRQVIITRGIFDQTRGAVEETASGFLHRQATVGASLSIRHEPIDQCELRKSDRVYFPERDELYEVSHIQPEPGGRPDVQLLRILEDEFK